MSYDALPATHYVVRKGCTLNFYRKGTACNNDEQWDECKITVGQRNAIAATCTIKSRELLRDLEPVLHAVFVNGASFRSKQLLTLLKAGE